MFKCGSETSIYSSRQSTSTLSLSLSADTMKETLFLKNTYLFRWNWKKKSNRIIIFLWKYVRKIIFRFCNISSYRSTFCENHYLSSVLWTILFFLYIHVVLCVTFAFAWAWIEVRKAHLSSGLIFFFIFNIFVRKYFIT